LFSSNAGGGGIGAGIAEGVDAARNVDKVVVLVALLVKFSKSSFSEELVKRSANGSWGLGSVGGNAGDISCAETG